MNATHSRAVELLDQAQGIIKGYHFIWGSPNGETGVGRDSYDTYFDKSRPPNYSAKGSLVGYPICVEHGSDPAIGVDAVAVITRTYFDDVGLAFEAQLDRSHPAYARTLRKIVNGDYRTSSSSAEHMADFYEDGAFRNWMHTETSLVENPAQAEMPAVSLLRGAEGERDARRASETPESGAYSRHPHYEMETRTMFNQQNPTPAAPPAAPAATPARSVEEELAAMVAAYGVDAVKAALDALSAQPGDMPAEQLSQPGTMLSRLRAALEGAKKDAEMATLRSRLDALEGANNAPPPAEPRATGSGAISVSEPRKYWHNNDRDMEFALMLMRSQRIAPSAEFLQVLGGRVQTALEKKDPRFDDRVLRAALPSTRANEVAISTASGGGDEWVAIDWSNSLWEVARDNLIYDQLVSKGMMVVEVPQGSESVYITTEGADPTVYTIAQNADLSSNRPPANIGATRIGTGRVLLTPGELGMAVVYSDVFKEDSIINVASQYNKQILRKGEETVEQLFINGDVQTSTTNINYDGGTPGTGLSTPYYIASNGAIKYALVTGSSTSRDGGALDENDYRLTLKLMPTAIRTRQRENVFIIDSDTHSASLDIAALKTDDVRRTQATITSGVMANIYGTDVFVSGMMLLADTDGKVTYNAAGTTGRILLIHAPYWAVGNKRQITVETDRDILSGDNIIVAKMRIGFMPRGAGAATISYNLTV